MFDKKDKKAEDADKEQKVKAGEEQQESQDDAPKAKHIRTEGAEGHDLLPEVPQEVKYDDEGKAPEIKPGAKTEDEKKD